MKKIFLVLLLSVVGCASQNKAERKISSQSNSIVVVDIHLEDYKLTVRENSEEFFSFAITYGGKKLYDPQPVFIEGVGNVTPTLPKFCGDLDHPPKGSHKVTDLIETYRSPVHPELIFHNAIKFKGFFIREASLPNQVVGGPSFTCSMIVLNHNDSKKLFDTLSSFPQENITIEIH